MNSEILLYSNRFKEFLTGPYANLNHGQNLPRSEPWALIPAQRVAPPIPDPLTRSCMLSLSTLLCMKMCIN